MQDRIVPLAIGCALALLTAIAVVASRRPVRSAVALLLHSLTLAALYWIMSADFVAMGQVIIYSGAIVVLILFVVLLLPQGGREQPPSISRWLAASLGAGLILAALAAATLVNLPNSGPASVQGAAEVGRSLFGKMIVPFELTAPLLLVGIIGAVALWRRLEKVQR